MFYVSTRNKKERVSASEAILRGLAKDGGLFMPEEIPSLLKTPLQMKDMSYQEIAYEVMSRFLTDFTEEELKECIARAYDEKFDDETIVPMAKVENIYHLELFHGPTIAFKDMALSILPHLMTTAAKKHGVTKEIVILTATSGDTGKAALAGFADVPGTRIIVFYPKGGVSRIQELQMTTQRGANVTVAAIHGNFDEAQSGVKRLFEDEALSEELSEAGFQFSSANSINIGRLVPQIVYYVYAYVKLLAYGEVAEGEEINVTVPTGNFGNILAAYLAKQMGLPIGKLVCASNENKVLFDFFESGIYDKNREFHLTTSPSMDILISSNLERLLYLASGENEKLTGELMINLKEKGSYEIPGNIREQMQDFAAGYADEAETNETIRRVYEATGYVMDTHTAVARAVCEAYIRETKDDRKMVLASTASPYKFAGSVLAALEGAAPETEEKAEGKASEGESAALEGIGAAEKNTAGTVAQGNAFAEADILERYSGVEVPAAVRMLEQAEVLHRIECEPKEMKKVVKKALGI